MSAPAPEHPEPATVALSLRLARERRDQLLRELVQADEAVATCEAAMDAALDRAGPGGH